MEWIIKNKDWIFSGIGISMPIAIIGWIFSSRRNSQKQRSGNGSTNIQVGGNFKIEKNKNDT
jgi:hypothetical protein